MTMTRLRATTRILPVVLLLLSCLAVSGQDSSLTVGATGSGFVVNSDGYILTNEHVIRDATKVTVHAAGQVYEAAVVVASEANDLALLKVPASGLTSVRLGNSLFVEPLEPVVAMGYPKSGYGEDLTTSTGEITSIRTNVPGREGKDTLQHDAVITYGSSGGPLFSTRGEVIGVNFAGDPPLNWAIPINDAIPLLRSIPGFDLRAMGQATAAMAASEVVDAYGGAVVFIDCTTEIALRQMLPSPESIPGFVMPGGYCVCEGTATGDDTHSAVSSWQGDWDTAVLQCESQKDYGTAAQLVRLGYPVTSWASMLAPLVSDRESESYSYAVTLIAFSTSEAAANAVPMMVGRTEDAGGQYHGFGYVKVLYASEGTTSARGLEAVYRLEAVELECGRDPYVWGQIIFTLGRVAARVTALLASTESECLGYTYFYQDGFLCRREWSLGPGGNLKPLENLLSMDSLAARLQTVADIAATVVLNRLR